MPAPHNNVSGDLLTIVQDDFAHKIVLNDEFFSNGFHLELNAILFMELNM